MKGASSTRPIHSRSLVAASILGFIACFPSVIPIAADATTSIEKDSTTYVLLLNPDCDWDFRAQFEHYMRIEQTPYDQYLDDKYNVVCLGGVADFADVEMYVAPALRKDLPYDDFVFVYPSPMVMAYHDYVGEKYGDQYRYMSFGSTDVTQGIAYVSEVPSYVKHEIAHLQLCGTWHDEDGLEIDQVLRHPEANDLAWCTH